MTSKEQKRVEEISVTENNASGSDWVYLPCDPGAFFQKNGVTIGDPVIQATKYGVCASDHDIQFIEKSRGDVRFLLDLVKRQEETIRRLRSDVRELLPPGATKEVNP